MVFNATFNNISVKLCPLKMFNEYLGHVRTPEFSFHNFNNIKMQIYLCTYDSCLLNY